jgi:hypothetical protein
MPIEYAYDSEKQLLTTIVSGDVGRHETAEYFRQVSREPWFPAPSLTDVRGASASLPSAEVRSMVELFRELGPRIREVPIAVLVDSDISYGLVRMLQLLLEESVTLRPFRDREKALHWLAERSTHATSRLSTA